MDRYRAITVWDNVFGLLPGSPVQRTVVIDENSMFRQWTDWQAEATGWKKADMVFTERIDLRSRLIKKFWARYEKTNDMIWIDAIRKI